MNLRPDERELEGGWISSGSGLIPDEVCKRIEHLVENVLHKVTESAEWGTWEVLYRDPADGRLWERTFPKGEMHGGGPPRLSVISPSSARAKYGLKEEST